MKKIKKPLVTLAVIFFLLLAIHPKTTEFVKAKTNNGHQDVQLLKEIELPHSSQIIYEKFNDGVLQYWDGVLYFHDMKGQQRWTKLIGAINPLIKTANNNVYILDNNKKQLTRLGIDGEEIYKLVLEKSIFNYNINKGQHVLLQIEDDNTPFNKILILSPKGEKIGEVAVGEGSIMSFSMDSYRSHIYIHTVTTTNNKIENNLIKYDNKGKLISLENLQDKLLMDYYYEDKAGLVMIFENAVRAIDDNREIKWEFPTGRIKLLLHQPENFTIINTSDTDKSGIIYGKSPDMLKVISNSGELISESILEGEPKGIDVHENDIILFTNRTLYIGNKNGGWGTEYKYTKDIEKAFVFPQGHIVIISKERISFLKF